MSGKWSRTWFHAQNWTWNPNATHVFSCKSTLCYCNSIMYTYIYLFLCLFISNMILINIFSYIFIYMNPGMQIFLQKKPSNKNYLGSIVPIYLGRISSPTRPNNQGPSFHPNHFTVVYLPGIFWEKKLLPRSHTLQQWVSWPKGGW